MPWMDIVILLVLGLAAIGGLRRGLFVEVCSLLGLVLGFLLASWHYRRPEKWLMPLVHNTSVADALGFVFIVVAVILFAGLTGRLLRSTFKWVGLGWADRTAGALFGLLKGYLLVTFGVMLIAAYYPQGEWFRSSHLASTFLATANAGTAVTPANIGDKIRKGIRHIEDSNLDWLRPDA